MSDSDNTPQSSSAQGLYLTIGPVAVVSAVYVIIFLILRRSNRRWYAPRTYLGTLKESERTPEQPSGFFGWIKSYFQLPDVYALQHQSLDAYLFLRFLRMTVLVTLGGCIITWPVLFPVNATGGGGQSQLDILSYSNVNNSTYHKRLRYLAHVFISWIYYAFVMFLIYREFVYYINLRQAFLLSPFYSQRLSSRTVLFTSVPENLRDERRIRKIFGQAVRNVWIVRDTKELEENVEDRDKAAYRLEKAEVKLIKLANKSREKSLATGVDVKNNNLPQDAEAGAGDIAAQWVPDKKRPTHRTGLLGLVGKKVDSITWCREEIKRLTPLVEGAQQQYPNAKPAPAVFVEFTTQAAAEAAYQTLAHHEGLHMKRYIGIPPTDVVWSSLQYPWYQFIVRRYAIVTFIIVLIIFWAIPVAVVGVISNVTYLEKLSFLTWLKKVPHIIMGFITGLLPSVALSVLMSLVPVVMRLCAKLSGEPSLARVELFTQNAYFCFQVVQVFLVTTVASSASAVVKQIVDNPGSVTKILANNLPKSSNFYMSYFIVQGLTIAASTLSQVAGFFIFHLMYKYITGTPRGLYQKWASLSSISWGSTLPVYTNIAVIGITYSIIAPLVLGWACLGMTCFYFAYRYNVLYVTDTSIDTRGLIYPRALKQLMTGIYLSQICMIGLYGASVAYISVVLQVIFLVFTLLVHRAMLSALNPLLYSLPQSLLAEEQARQDGNLENAAAAAGPGAPALAAGGAGGAGVAADGVISDKAAAAAPAAAADNAAPANGVHSGYTGAVRPAPAKVNAIVHFFKPWVYDSYEAMRQLVPEHGNEVNFERMYTPEVEQNAYLPPAVSNELPLLWIPEDRAGVSKQEIVHSQDAIDMTDEGCVLTEKGKLEWDRDNLHPPIWSEKVLY